MRTHRNFSKKPIMAENKYITDRFMIKKRSDFWENEICKENSKNYDTLPTIGDRFIPRRQLTSEYRNKTFLSNNSDLVVDILEWDPPHNFWLQHKMKSAINRAFNLQIERVLQFSDISCINIKTNNKHHARSEFGLDWACRPRNKPLAFSETTHDSVGVTNCFGRNMMDWSVNGQVVASYESDVTIWKHLRSISVTFHVEAVSCLAYCPKGQFLAIGCKISRYPVIELWDVNKYSIKVEVVRRHFFKSSSISIHCFEWSKCGSFLVCGASTGVLYIFSVPKLKFVQKIQEHRLPVKTIRFSSNMQYLASGDSSGNVVVYNWFSLKVCLQVRWKRTIDVLLDWHPWNGVELVIAENSPASIVLLHVPSKKITAFYRRKDKNIRIDSVTFNKITAELLLSISREGPTGMLEQKVMVLASLDRVVDVLTIQSGARFLMWNPDGTNLVTAGEDESLTIWSFYPKSISKRKENSIESPTEIKQKIFSSRDSSSQCLSCSIIR